MDRKTFDATLGALKSRRPFRPFTLALINGDRLGIDHPDALLIREGTGLFAGPGGIPHVFDYEGVAEVIGDLSGNSSE